MEVIEEELTKLGFLEPHSSEFQVPGRLPGGLGEGRVG